MKKIFFCIGLIAVIFFTCQNQLRAQGNKPIPINSKGDGITYQILIDDHPIGPNVEIFSIEVKSKLKDVSTAEIKFYYNGSAADFVLVNKKISVMIGYHNNNAVVFEGTTNKHIIEQEEGKTETMSVEAEGESPKSNDKRPVLSLTKGSTVIEYKFEVKGDMKTIGKLFISGRNEVKVGSIIELNGFGGRFNGEFKVTTIEHKFKEDIWETILTVRK